MKQIEVRIETGKEKRRKLKYFGSKQERKQEEKTQGTAQICRLAISPRGCRTETPEHNSPPRNAPKKSATKERAKKPKKKGRRRYTKLIENERIKRKRKNGVRQAEKRQLTKGRKYEVTRKRENNVKSK